MQNCVFACWCDKVPHNGMQNTQHMISKVKGEKPSKHTVLSEEEVEALMAACNHGVSGGRDRALISLTYKCGLRVSEALGIMPSDLNWKDGEIRVREGKKGAGGDLSPLTSSCKPEIDYWLSVREKLGISSRSVLFCTISQGEKTESGQRLHRNHLNNLLKRLAKKAGIEKPVSPHVLRRSCATHLLAGGMGLNLVQCHLRHKSIASTIVYTRVCKRKQAAQKAQDIGW